jgi:hypothetical protein
MDRRGFTGMAAGIVGALAITPGAQAVTPVKTGASRRAAELIARASAYR